MNHISEIKPGSARDDRMAADDILRRIYDLMTATYGHKFTARYGWEDRKAWGFALRGCSLESITGAMQRLRDEHPEWPPEPNQFYQMCVNGRTLQLDDEGNDATWQQKQIERATQEWDEQQRRLTTNTNSETARQKGRETLDSLKVLFG